MTHEQELQQEVDALSELCADTFAELMRTRELARRLLEGKEEDDQVSS